MEMSRSASRPSPRNQLNGRTLAGLDACEKTERGLLSQPARSLITIPANLEEMCR